MHDKHPYLMFLNKGNWMIQFITSSFTAIKSTLHSNTGNGVQSWFSRFSIKVATAVLRIIIIRLRMVHFKLIVLTVLIAVSSWKLKYISNVQLSLHEQIKISCPQSALSQEEGEGNDKDKNSGECNKGWKHGKHGKHHERMMKCIKQTNELKDCCTLPQDDSIKEDPECKHHLEGIEGKEKHEKMKAYKCFTDCIFNSKGLMVDGNIDAEKFKEMSDNMLTENGQLEFKSISDESIDFCSNQSKSAVVPESFYNQRILH